MPDYYEDLANEMGNTDRYVQPDEEDDMDSIAKKVPQAEVTRTGALDMQVCVPKDWSDERVKSFADANNWCGTTNGWFIRKQGHRALCGANERVPCRDRQGFVHVMLDA